MPSVSHMVEWVKAQCNASNVGYSLDLRDSISWYKGSGNYYFDCSSLMCYALIEGGWDVHGANPSYGYGYAFNTDGEPGVLEALGWKDIGGSAATVSVGDIGHIYGSERGTRYGHTEMCCEAGSARTAKWMGAHGVTNYSWADQVSLNGTKTWKRIYHWYGEDSETGGSGGIPVYDISMEVVAAIAGNWWYESTGINPGRWEISAKSKTWTALGEGYGLGQWTNTDGNRYGRLYQLSQYLSLNGYSYISGAGQVAFLIEENVWQTYNSWQKFDGYNSLSDFLHTSETDINYLTEIFLCCWEGIRLALSDRQNYAQRAYDYIKEHYNDDVGWIARDDYLSDSEALNNAVCLYKCLMNYANNVAGDTGATDAHRGDNGNNQSYKEVDPCTLSYEDLMALAFGNLSKSEKEALLSIHKPPRGIK